MGSVYLARDIRSGGREVAIKILHSANLRPDLTLRDGMTLSSLGGQSAEARFLASCEHASILPVYDAGTDPDTGLTFFTMRACLLSRDEMERLCDNVLQCPYPYPWSRHRWDDGPSALTLRDLLRGRRALPEKCVARIGIDIVEALSCVHSRVPPLLHRDIKPSNILFDASGRAILSDFGIANEIFADNPPPAGPAPAPGSGDVRRGFAGTPAYAAPEQRDGAACSSASDYYSLGVVLHEALTGERLFGSARPSRFDPSGISRQWDTLLPGLLDPDPARRLSDPGRILGALRAIADRRRSQRRILLWVAAVCAAVAVVLGFGSRILESANGASAPGEAETADPAAVDRRAAEVDRQVKLLQYAPIWPNPAEPWFPAVLMPPRPENNRRHLDGAVFEMLLPGGVPMQFAAMTINQNARYIRYSHGYFRDADGRPNMAAGERKAHDTVVSKRLLVSRTEVTQEQFDAVMSATGAVPLQTLSCADWATNAPAAMERLGMGPSEFNSRLKSIGRLLGRRDDPDLSEVSMQAVFMRVSILKSPQPGMPAAEGLRFADVERFIEKLNSLTPEGCEFRLPTEAEWEAACRMTSDRPFEGDEPGDVCWSRENSGGAPHGVALKKRSAFGFFDMHGNVAEWCLDGFRPLVRPAFDPVVPVASDGLRVVKGGSWADPAEECGSEARRAAGPDDTGIGIRLVLEY